jgi:Phage portal protein
MAKNRIQLAWDALTNKNSFNSAIYKMVGGLTTTYNRTLETLLIKGYGENPDVNAIINQQASKTTAVPYYIKKIEDKVARKKLKQFPNNPTFQQKLSIQKLEQKAFKSDSEQPMPIERPNPNQTWNDIFFLYKVYLKACGNVYLYKQTISDGVNAGQPLQLYILPSHWMQIVLKKNANMLSTENPIDYFIMEQGLQLVKFNANEIIHIKRSNPFYDQSGSHLYGFSELMAAIRNINSSNNAIDNNAKTMLNSGVYGFIHAGDGATPLTHEQGQSLKDRLIEMDNDTTRLSNIAGSSAKLGFTRISLTTDELKPFDYLSYDRRTLANCLNWNVDLLNEEKNGSGFGVDTMNEARKRVITDNIKPDLDLFADYLNLEFIQKFKGYENSELIFDISELPEMQTDMSEMAKWINQVPLTLNERREVFKYEPIEDDTMNEVYIPNGIVNINDVAVIDDSSNGQI